VFDTCNNSLGRVLDVINLPTNNSILIKCNNKEIMVPIIDDFIELFDFKNKKIIIRNSDIFINKC
jgi:ribosomal 30S subunit maturation factor RimM